MGGADVGGVCFCVSFSGMGRWASVCAGDASCLCVCLGQLPRTQVMDMGRRMDCPVGVGCLFGENIIIDEEGCRVQCGCFYDRVYYCGLFCGVSVHPL